MAKQKVKIPTNAEIDAVLARAANAPEKPRLESIEYKAGRGLDLFILRMSDGQRYILPREKLQGLENATRDEAADVEIVGFGTGLHWPQLDADLYVPSLLQGIYGNPKWMASLGKLGGASTSDVKRRAAAENGRKGGRPRHKIDKSAMAA